MGKKIKATLIAAAIVGGTVLTPAVAEAQQVAVSNVAAQAQLKGGPCPWWVANGYWRVIWYWGTGQCR